MGHLRFKVFFGLFSFCLICTLVNGISLKRVIKQLNSLRTDLSFVSTDVFALSESVTAINKTLWSNSLSGRCKGLVNENEESDRSIPEVTNEAFERKIIHLFEAFAAEKLSNRQLQNRLLGMLEKKQNEIEKMFESERGLCMQLQAQLDELEVKYSNITEELKTELRSVFLDISKLSRLVDSVKRLSEVLRLDVEDLEQSNSENSEALNAERRLNKALLTRVRALESEKRDTAEILNRLTNLEDSTTELIKNFTSERENIKHIENQLNITNKPAINEAVVTTVSSITDPSTSESDASFEQTTTVNNERDRTTFGGPLLLSCKEAPSSGVYNVHFSSLGVTKSVYCDAETDGGGWTVTLRRQNGSVNFDRTWNEYKNGFGNPDGEFWIGNDILHELTKTDSMELRIDMKSGWKKVFAKYSHFSVGSEVNNYILAMSGYSGTAGDGLEWHRGMKFTTRDKDNDRNTGGNCADDGDGGWWHNVCYASNLNNKYRYKKTGMYWAGVGYLQFAEMKLR